MDVDDRSWSNDSSTDLDASIDLDAEAAAFEHFAKIAAEDKRRDEIAADIIADLPAAYYSIVSMVDTLVPADAFSDLFEYLLHCIVNRDLKRTQRSAATRVFDSPRAVALWNKVSEKADTMLAMDFMTDSLRNSIKKNSVGLTSAEFDPAGQLFHAVAFGLPCPPERWAGGAQSDDIYDRVRVYGENIWVESSAPPCTMNQVILILHAMTVCHCWFMLARSLYTTLLAHHPELARTNLRYSTNSGTSDAVLASTYLAKARELGLENSLRMNLFRILMSPTVAFD